MPLSTTDWNQISELWFRTFLDTIDPAQTAAEVAFLQRQLPLPEYRRVLDLCCGNGRHAVPLSESGYQITGVDRDAALLAQASARAPQAIFLQADARDLTGLRGEWDAAIIMWASFGYFTEQENAAQLAALQQRLRPGGRLILDIYNYDFFSAHQGEHIVQRGGLQITEHKHIRAGRLFVELHYPNGYIDHFTWQIFRPSDLAAAAQQSGFTPLLLCSGFQESTATAPEHGRMQVVLQRD